MQSNALNSTATDIDLAVNDLGPLAWVLDELRKSLDSAAKALKRFVRDAEAARGSDLAAIDASQLRIARQQLHQAVGALEMVGLTGPALVLRAMEAAVQKFVQQPEQCNQEAAARIERASFALTEYLEAVLADKPISAVSLFPQYREVQELVRADRIHPADLWPNEWRWIEPEFSGGAQAVPYNDAARGLLDQSVLQIMRGDGSHVATGLKDLSMGFAAAQTDRQPRIFWKIAAAYFEALANGLIVSDIYIRRAASRVLLQYASLSKGNHGISERLAQDLLFFCSQAVSVKAGETPVLSAVRAAYGLAKFKPVDYEAVQFGRFDPALLAQARKRIVSAKETWSSLSAGDASKFKQVVDQFSLVCDSLVKLHPPSEPLAQALSRAVDSTVRSGQPPAIELAMEVATSVLYLEAAFEDLDPRDSQLAERTAHLAERLESVRAGGQPQPLMGWMEELYRRVSDRQTMGSVVGELRISLGELEKSLDMFFRNPQDKSVLRDVPGQLSQMRGVLSVLGLEQASQAVLRMRDSVEEMLVTEVDEQRARAAGTFDQLGNNLGALSFLIDMLNYQPALAKKLFVYDNEKGELKPLMGLSHKPDEALSVTVPGETLVQEVNAVVVLQVKEGVTDEILADKLDALASHAALAGQPELAQTAHATSVAVSARDHAATADAMLQLASSVAPAVVPPPPFATAAEDFEEDDLRDIFLEEAREVTVNGQEAVRLLAAEPSDIGQLTVLRRVFHTLKGSSRMVGLNEFGEAAWSLEQMLNSWLADQKPSSEAMRRLSAEALAAFSTWIEDIAANQDGAWLASSFRTSAEAMHMEERYVAIALPGSASLESLDAAASIQAPEVPKAFDSDPIVEESTVAVTVFAPAGVDLVSDLSEPETAEVPASAPIEVAELSPPALSATPLPIESEEILDFDAFFELDPLPVSVPVDLAVSYAIDAVEPIVGQAKKPADADATVDEVERVNFDTLAMLANTLQPLPEAAKAAITVEEADAKLRDEPEIAAEQKFLAAESGLPPATPIEVSEISTADFEAQIFADLLTPQNDGENKQSDAEISLKNLDSVVSGEDIEGSDAETSEDKVQTAAVVSEIQSATSEKPELAELAEPVTSEEAAEPAEPAEVAGAGSLADGSEPVDVVLSKELLAQAQTIAELETAVAVDENSDDEQVKVIGNLRIGIPLYNVYLNEADEWSRRLVTEVSEWALEGQNPVSDSTVALAHSLSGSSATVGFDALSEIARALESALQKAQTHHDGTATASYSSLFVDAAEDIRRLLHQFAAGFMKYPDPALLERLRKLEFAEPVFVTPGEEDEFEFAEPETTAFQALEVRGQPDSVSSPQESTRSEPADGFSFAPLALQTTMPMAAIPLATSFSPASAASLAGDEDDEIDAVDAIDQELFPIFDEEAAELMPQLGGALRQWAARPDNQSARMEVLRALHTLKGSARLAGALRLGEMAHRIESEIEYLGSDSAASQDFDPLLTRFDAMQLTLENLRKIDLAQLSGEAASLPVDQTRVAYESAEPVNSEDPLHEDTAQVTAEAGTEKSFTDAFAMEPGANTSPSPDETRPELLATSATVSVAANVGKIMIPAPQSMAMQPLRQAASASIRVKSQLLDRLVNQAGEVMITRSRLEVELNQLRGSLNDMSGNLNRLRQQLRDIELQAETQMQSRLAQAKELQAGFDPLEFDRFTRVQELTRMMAESVNDVATVQRTLQRTVEATEDDLIAQARQTRELQRDLLRTRMVEFEGISDRLYRVVRQASKETGKQVRLDLLGGTIEMDRGMLDRMTPAFEHLLRNCVAHGIESPEIRTLAGKEPVGLITVHLRQEGNDVSVDFSDDGAGLDLGRIREKALALGMITAGQVISDAEAANLIFLPGFTTASQVTELAGRGIGMDVVRSEVNGVGGRIETATVAGGGTHFKLVLPLTTAVTQVVMLRCGNLSIGVPANVVENVRRASAKEVQQAYNSGVIDVAGEAVPFFWSGALLQTSHNTGEAQGKTSSVVVFRSAAQRVALHVDEVLGNQEVVVKNLGPQLSRLPGLAGMSVLASGAVVLIYNPVALASIYGEQARGWSRDSAEPHVIEAAMTGGEPRKAAVSAVAQIPLIMVVDDSITVRRVTQRLLQREGYRVVMAADGLQALERLQEERPAVVLSDIEMPRMDGFDLARNIRADPRLAGLPIVMITSRIAEKHREHAKELGVDHYLGKPYAEDELMSLVRHYCNAEVAV